MITKIPALLAFSAAFACSAGPRTAVPSDGAGRGPDPQELVAAHDEAWNAHNPVALADLFVDDGTLVTPAGRKVDGRDALVQTFAAPSPTKDTTSSTRIDSVRTLADDVVLIAATQTLAGPGVEVLGGSQAQMLAVATEHGGRLRFVAVSVFAPRPELQEVAR